jgi:hypothetical protein
MRPERDGSELLPAAGDPHAPEAARPLWLAALVALGIVTLILATFTVLFTVATGSAPPWWPQ